MSYAVAQSVKDKLENLSENISDTVLNESINSIDIIIKSELQKNNITPPTSNDTLTKAANYLVSADMIDYIDSGGSERNSTAVTYDKKGYALIEAYIDATNHSGEGSPYTRNNTDMTWYDNRRQSGFRR